MSDPALPSIRRRLAASLLWISLLASGLTGLMIWKVIGHEIDEQVDQKLTESAEIIHNLLPTLPANGNVIAGTPGDEEYEEHLIWQVVDSATGRALIRSHNAPEQALQKTVSHELADSADRHWRLITIDFKKSPDRFLLVAQNTEERDEAYSAAILYAALISLLAGLVSTLLLSWQFHRELEPLARLSEQVKTYDPLRPDTLPRAATRAELQPIEQAIHELGQRLAQRVISERAFTSHAAHALRTPVAGIDAQLAIALREAPEALRPRLIRARQAASRLSRVMQALLAMFRSGMDPQRQTIRLSELLQPLSFNELQIDIRNDEALSADPDLLTAALLNLLDNAQRHQARQVQLILARDAGWTRLRLHDDGAGCPPERLQQLRQALARQDYGTDSGLKGLGLILADLVMRAHGGRMELPQVEQGFCVDLNWPST
ncbi:MAG: ATP-binding protein [Rhodoferax sp.]|uniref:sensor histidine kinase n=1 Tax=Rhodoferax sp. TaxID=50421 RepID=UPI003BAF40DB